MEPIRLLLEDLKQEYEDIPVGSADWPELKRQCAFKQLPMVQDGDFKIVQSNAILRHFGRKFEKAGKTAKDQTAVDMLMDAAEDIRVRIGKLVYVDRLSDAAKASHFDEYLPGQLSCLEELLAQNNDGTGFFVGDDMTIADISVWNILELNHNIVPSCLDKFPLLKGDSDYLCDPHNKLCQVSLSVWPPARASLPT